MFEDIPFSIIWMIGSKFGVQYKMIDVHCGLQRLEARGKKVQYT
jgi:hypothetical protein